MQSRVTNFLRTIVEYFQIIFKGVLRIYSIVVEFILQRLKLFRKNEIVYYVSLLVSAILTALDWRSYDIIINSEIVHHGISTDDFLIFVSGLILMAIPGMLKFIYFIQNKKLFTLLYSFGMAINIFMYLVNALHPERIAKTTEASFTIWFYLFGFSLVFSAIFGVLSIVTMPSTHSENGRL